ncbi:MULTISPECIES: hypothetical protein [Bacteria]|uniref:hypothetical protein n=1 Tax=Bacteria TaxID=2 RepID=UPI002E7C1D45|nr:hypothetical protein [Cetobacterium somerae]WVJ03055.1 hypothetical protein VSU16_15095 [Cetobacterium somerae]
MRIKYTQGDSKIFSGENFVQNGLLYKKSGYSSNQKRIRRDYLREDGKRFFICSSGLRLNRTLIEYELVKINGEIIERIVK